MPIAAILGVDGTLVDTNYQHALAWFRAEATKPEPDLVLAAMDEVDTGEAVMVGDSIWDCEAARRAGIQTWPC
jgi:beta-phosphoglucomutase-like phosphatase (HAD superfamily)